MTDFCGAFFRIPIHPDDQYCLCLHFKWTTIHMDYNAIGLHWKLHLLLSDNKSWSRRHRLSSEVRFDTICRRFTAVFKSSINSQQNTLYFLQKLGLKRHKMSKEKLQNCKTSIKYLGHRISKEGLLIDLGRVKDILTLIVPKTDRQLRDF